ncbi:MAG: diguanylate cyclase [bacterium]|nr:diguanylate cyclase [bacterium]
MEKKKKGRSKTAQSLAERLQDLLDRAQPKIRDLETELEAIERSHGPAVYCEWLYLLGGVRVAPTRAKDRWRAVLRHWTAVETNRIAAFDPRVALVSYSIEAQRKLGKPIDIEIHLGEPRRDHSDRDELTGLANSESFSESLGRELHRGERFNRPVSLLMIDIDNFEHYNECNGRESGDRALATIGRILGESLRVDDGKTRLGGKEFALTLPATPKVAAAQVAERIREQVELQYFPGEDHQPGGKLTVRVGVATFPGDARNAAELLRQAQRAAFSAKAGGRNQVHLIGEDRRSNRRFEVVLGGSFSTWTTSGHRLKTLNLSLAGLKFSSSENLPPGALVDVRLEIPGSEPNIEMAVRVVKSDMVRPPSMGWIAGGEQMVGGRYEIATRTIEISSEHLRILRHYLRTLENSSPAGG